MATLEELETRTANLEALIGTLPTNTNVTTIVGYVDKTMQKANEALLTAEAANAKASNAEQLAINAFYTIQDTDATINAKIGTLPDGQTVVGYVDEKTADAGFGEEEINALLNPIKDDVGGIKLDINDLKNTPKYKLMWTASELQEKLGGVLDGEVDVLKPYDGSVTITGGAE